MTAVRQILNSKGRQAWSTRPDATVMEAVQFMSEKRVGALLVLEKDKLIGMFSERDVAMKVVLNSMPAKTTLVRDVMSTKLTCIMPETTVEEAMAIMTEKRVRHLPVMRDGQIQGVVSVGDAVKSALDEKDFHIKNLERYIMGG